MDRQEFVRISDACLEKVARFAEGFDPDELDYSTQDGVVSLEFADGVRFVLNRQAPSSQMWYAAGARAWHYNWIASKETWLDDRDGHELLANVGRTVSEKLGRKVEGPTV